MRTLTKSKLLAFRQCPKRLWLEIHRRELRHDSSATKASFRIGHQVGEIARKLYDSKGTGHLIDAQVEGFGVALTRSAELLNQPHPIFEAGFSAGGVLAFADVMLSARKAGKRVWRMVEVKSSTEVKDYHLDDVAVQAYVARNAGVSLASVSLAYIDSKWIYPGNGSYQGFLSETDLTDEAFSRSDEVEAWIVAAQKIASKRKEPKQGTGRHCKEPFECGFLGYCQRLEEQSEYPVTWLPSVQSKALKARIEDYKVTDLRNIPDDLLNDRQLRVKALSLSGETYFDAPGAAAVLAPHKLPAYFLDFETIQLAVPFWKGTRPFQQIPFQFSVHRLSRTGKLNHHAFLDLSGKDPSKEFAESLITSCGERGPVFAYGAGFERGRIKELADRFPRLKKHLLAINDRVVDLLEVAKEHYYHPSQQGSWSLKKVLPAVAPDLRYDELDGVQNGGMAMEAFREAISSDTTRERKAQIEQQLLAYCCLDTYAMVKLWRFFSGRYDMDI